MPLTVRLGAKTERTLNSLAKRRQVTRSEIVREAIAHYDASQRGHQTHRPYDAWVGAIGVIDAGVRARGRTTGDQFAALLHKQTRARRAR